MPSVGDDEVAQALGADGATVHALRDSRIVAVDMDSQVRPEGLPLPERLLLAESGRSLFLRQ